MMKLFLIILLISSLIIANGKVKSGSYEIDIDIMEYIRTNYYASVENEGLVEKLEEFIKERFTSDSDEYPNLILAYVAALESVKSKHAFWPFTKLKYFNKSMEIFNKAISKEPNSLEIRFLRFTILHYVPAILGHSEERRSDADEIVVQLLKKDYSSIKPEIQQGIAEFLIKSNRLSPYHKKLITDNFVISINNE